MSENKIVFTSATVSELIQKLQGNDLAGALRQVFSSEAMAKLTTVQNRIKTLEPQRNILDSQIQRISEELTELIATAEIAQE